MRIDYNNADCGVPVPCTTSNTVYWSGLVCTLGMPPSYSTDLRHRIVWLSVVHNASPTAISRLLHVSSRTVTRYVELFNRTGDVLPRDRCNGPHRLLASSPGPQLDRIGGVTGEERKAEAKTEGLVNGVDRS